MTGFEQLRGLVARRGDLTFADAVETVPLAQGFEFVPIDEATEGRIGAVLAGTDPDTAGKVEFLIATVLDCLGAKARVGSTVAHLLVTPFGQYTYAFRDGQVTEWHTHDYETGDVAAQDMPVNRTLRHLGVERGEAAGEVAAIGLRLPEPE